MVKDFFIKQKLLGVFLFLFLFLFLFGFWPYSALFQNHAFAESGFNFDTCCDSSDKNPVLKLAAQTQCVQNMKKKACQDITPKYKKDCTEKNIAVNVMDLIGGCFEGVYNSTFSMLKFVWVMMKGIFAVAFFESNRNEVIEGTWAFMQSARNYLNIHYAQANGDMFAIASSVFSFVYNATQTLLKDFSDQYQCLNSLGQSEMICNYLSKVTIPPTTIFAIMKYGIKGAEKLYPAIKIARQSFVKQSKEVLSQQSTSHWKKLAIKGSLVGGGSIVHLVAKGAEKSTVNLSIKSTGKVIKTVGKSEAKDEIEDIIIKNLLLNDTKNTVPQSQ